MASLQQRPRSSSLNAGGKRFAPKPTEFSEIIEGTLVDLAKVHLVRFNSRSKAAVILCAVTFFSLFGGRFLASGTPPGLAATSSPLNQWFVKLGWFWTLIACGPFIVLTSSIYGLGNILVMTRHLSRLVVGTIAWYVVVNGFVSIERRSRYCSVSGSTGSPAKFTNLSMKACAAAGGKWHSFDISGHCFLMIYSILIIAEESRALWNWVKIRTILEDQKYIVEPANRRYTLQQVDLALDRYHQFKPWINAWFVVFMSGISLIWYWQLTLTSLYYHTVVHKILGSLVAVIIWFLTYHVWYTSPYSPSLPGRGYLPYQSFK